MATLPVYHPFSNLFILLNFRLASILNLLPVLNFVRTKVKPGSTKVNFQTVHEQNKKFNLLSVLFFAFHRIKPLQMMCHTLVHFRNDPLRVTTFDSKEPIPVMLIVDPHKNYAHANPVENKNSGISCSIEK